MCCILQLLSRSREIDALMFSLSISLTSFPCFLATLEFHIRQRLADSVVDQLVSYQV